MDGRIDLITLISLIVALVVILKLRSVLGRRTEEDDARMERYRAEQQQRAAASAANRDKVVTLPQRGDHQSTPAANEGGLALAEVEERIRAIAGSNREVERGLLDIYKADSTFDPEHFLRGAKQA